MNTFVLVREAFGPTDGGQHSKLLCCAYDRGWKTDPDCFEVFLRNTSVAYVVDADEADARNWSPRGELGLAVG